MPLYFRENGFLDLLDSGFVALVERPLFDSLGTGQSGLAEDFHVFTGCWLADAEFAGNQNATNSVLH